MHAPQSPERLVYTGSHTQHRTHATVWRAKLQHCQAVAVAGGAAGGRSCAPGHGADDAEKARPGASGPPERHTPGGRGAFRRGQCIQAQAPCPRDWRARGEWRPRLHGGGPVQRSAQPSRAAPAPTGRRGPIFRAAGDRCQPAAPKEPESAQAPSGGCRHGVHTVHMRWARTAMRRHMRPAPSVSTYCHACPPVLQASPWVAPARVYRHIRRRTCTSLARLRRSSAGA